MLQVKIVPVTAFAQNCSIVWDSDTLEAVLIDAGGEPEKLKQEAGIEHAPIALLEG